MGATRNFQYTLLKTKENKKTGHLLTLAMGGGRSNHSVHHCAEQYGDFSENHVDYCGMQRGLCWVYTPRALGVGSQRDLHSHIHSHIVHNVGPPKCPSQMNLSPSMVRLTPRKISPFIRERNSNRHTL